MSSNEAKTCPLCRHENVKIFAVGDCSHPICFVCATKMRVLCEQTYCAICRQELPRVYYVSDSSEIRGNIDQSRFTAIDETGECGIYYPTKADWIRYKTENLLRNFCRFCGAEFETFDVLREHVRKHHRYFYCDLCVAHLNLFPHERKCYTRSDLVLHIRQGDKDDRSFKGHPLCKFCDDHFLDNDQLYKHMRQEHYYCHLCTSDSVFYGTFDLLRNHYRESHFLCEIGQCRDVQFTNVFPNEVEFRAHQASQHGKTRAGAKKLGTIQVGFQSSSVRDRPQPQQRREPSNRETTASGNSQTQVENNGSRSDRGEENREGSATASVPSIDEFPTLNQRPDTPQNISQQRGAWGSDLRRNFSNDEFPALISGATSSTSQPRGFWRENQSQAPATATVATSSSTTSKKATPAVKTVTDATSNLNIHEDFPALQGASSARIAPPVSMLSAWSKAKSSAKSANANKKGNQPQMRMNTSRLMREDDDDDDYVRRPMAALMASNAPAVSSNITMISAPDVSSAQSNTNKNQSVPKPQDFPALPTTVRTPTVNTVSSSVWGNGGKTSAAAAAEAASSNSSTSKQKKKSGVSSKKKFIEEVQSLPPAQESSTARNDLSAMGLSELGRRLITDETPSESKAEVKEEKPSSTPPLSTNPNETKSTTSSKKKKSPKGTTNTESTEKQPQTTPEKTSATISKTESTSASPSKPVKSAAVAEAAAPALPSPPAPPPPPPGFAAVVAAPVPPPPGFNAASSSSPPTPPSYVYSSTHAKQKEDFREKLLNLFDGDMNLFLEYDKFCQAFSEKAIDSADFIKFTRELFQNKFSEYLLDLIVLIPNIEQQNELYNIWKTENQLTSTSSSSSSSSSSSTSSNWTKKNPNGNNVYQCRVCRQIMFDSDTNEHNSQHSEFNAEFPSLPSAAVPLGRGRGKKNK